MKKGTNKETTDFSRRDFLKSTALAGAGLSMAGLMAACSPNSAGDQAASSGSSAQSAENVEWKKEADVVAVGYGGAGAAAAIEAKKAGANVVLLEMNKQAGGSTIANGGFIMMGGTDLQKKNGLEDSVENYYAYLSTAAGENANQEAIKLICDSSPDLYRWCVECGMDFESGACDTEHHLGGYNAGTSLGYSGNEMAAQFAKIAKPVPRGHMAQPGSSGKDMFEALAATVESAGVEVLYETPGTRLVKDETGRVVGIVAKSKDGEIAIKANKGIVLTCGGFVDNTPMLDAFYPFVNKRGPRLTTAGSENGSGILMGVDAGAATFGMGCFQVGYTISTASEPMSKGLLIDEYANRIVAEDEYNSFIGKAIIQAPTSKCFLIVDDATMKEADVSRFGEPLASAADFSELAAQLEVNEAVLQQTVSFYNESAAMGEDRQFGKDPKFLHALEEGPFHAFDAGSENCYTASCGGLKIDLGAHVLDSNDEVIPGLYSAGRNAGTIYGWYMGSGSSMADVFTFGRIAGQNAAAGN